MARLVSCARACCLASRLPKARFLCCPSMRVWGPAHMWRIRGVACVALRCVERARVVEAMRGLGPGGSACAMPVVRNVHTAMRSLRIDRSDYVRRARSGCAYKKWSRSHTDDLCNVYRRQPAAGGSQHGAAPIVVRTLLLDSRFREMRNDVAAGRREGGPPVARAGTAGSGNRARAPAGRSRRGDAGRGHRRASAIRAAARVGHRRVPSLLVGARRASRRDHTAHDRTRAGRDARTRGV